MIIKTTKRCNRQWKKQEIQVAAAASLTDVTKKLASEFKKSIKMLILNLTMVDQGIKKTN